jgi:dolichol-phosphate mannosyltransferase
MKFVIVLPTYNEAENLPRIISALFMQPLEISLLVVDDNSPDGTGSLADSLAKEYDGRMFVLHRPGRQGLGSAYIEGFRKARELSPHAIIQMDADFSHDPEVLPIMAGKLDSCSVVMGSRYIEGGSLDERWPLWRKWLSAFGNFYARGILRFPVRDATGGYRMWKCATLMGMPLSRIRSNGYAFQVEMAYVAHLMRFDITETPIHFADRRWGKSKMTLRIQLEAAFRVWDVWWRYRDLRRTFHLTHIRHKGST